MTRRAMPVVYLQRSLALAAVVMCVLMWPAAAAIENADCFACHADKDLVKTNEAGKAVALLVEEKVFKSSIHFNLGCIDCHAGIKELPHENVVPVNCTACHDSEGKEYATSIHGMSRAMGSSGAANCKDCHGHHDILPVKHPASPVFKLNLPQTCAKCHSNPSLTHEYRICLLYTSPSPRD